VIPSEELIIDFLKGEGLFLVDPPDEKGKWNGLIRFKKGLNSYSVFFENKTCSLRIYKARQKMRRPYPTVPAVRGGRRKLEIADHDNISVNLYEEDSLDKIAAWL